MNWSKNIVRISLLLVIAIPTFIVAKTYIINSQQRCPHHTSKSVYRFTTALPRRINDSQGEFKQCHCHYQPIKTCGNPALLQLQEKGGWPKERRKLLQARIAAMKQTFDQLNWENKNQALTNLKRRIIILQRCKNRGIV